MMKLPVFAALFISLSACAQTAPPDAKADAKADAGAKPAAEAAEAAKPSAEATTAQPGVALKGPADARVQAALKSINPQIEVDRIAAAPLPGFREAIVGGQVLYVSDDGKYLLQGTLFDIERKRDLSQVGISVLRREELAKIPAKDKIVFAPAKPKYTLEVFTDIECGYCRKMHQDIAEYNRLGIAIEYLAFPRAGTASQDFRNMESVWCSSDRRKALTDAKNGLPVPAKNCSNPVNMQYQIGQKIGLSGTPMLVTRDGIVLPGYLPPAALLQTLQRLETEAKEAKPAQAANAGSESAVATSAP